MKNKIFYLTLLLLFAVTLSLPYVSNPTQYTSNTQKIGQAIISVFDSQENTPIQNATICILETKEYYQTNKLGSIKFSLPANNNNSLKYSSPKKDWQEYTLLIYKNGYYPHLYFGLKIKHNTLSSGIAITLKNLSFPNDTPYTTDYSYPTHDWLEQIINEYKI